MLFCFFLTPLNNEISAQTANSEDEKSIPIDLSDPKPIEPVKVNETAFEPILRKAEMRLTGSMCIACVNRLNKILKSQYGIIKVKIDLAQAGFYDPSSPSMLRWAQATIVYDASQISLMAIRNYIEELGYSSYKVKDTSIDSVDEK